MIKSGDSAHRGLLHALQSEPAGKGSNGAPTRTAGEMYQIYPSRGKDYFYACLLTPALSMAGVKDLLSW